MGELRQAVDAVKNQGKFHRAFLLVVDALDKFENFERSYLGAESSAANANAILEVVRGELEVAKVDKDVLTAEVEALHIEKARAKNQADQEAQDILRDANLKALGIVEEIGIKGAAFDEEMKQRQYVVKEAHDVAMASYAEQQAEAREHLRAVKEELAALKARFDA